METREQIEQAIEKLENRIFALEMCDHWTDSDHKRRAEYSYELQRLYAKLRETENA